MTINRLNPDTIYSDLYTVYDEGTFLRTPSKDVKTINNEIKVIIESMFYVVLKYGGLGLSAPQVGRHLRVFVLTNPRIVMINPNMTKKYGKVQIDEEGCLSIPNYFVKVPRPKYVHMEWYDEDAQFHEGTFSGQVARIIQHEYDHLDGLLIDRYEK